MLIMKFCPKCGNKLDDSAMFCSQCGTSFENPQSGASNPQPQGGQQQNQQFRTIQQQVQNPVYGPGIAAQRRVAMSMITLIAIGAYSASILFSFINSIVHGNSIMAYLYDLAYQLRINEMVRALNGMTALNVLMAFIGLIPALLIALGLWMTYLSLTNKQSIPVKTEGLTIIKVVLMIEMVAMALVLVIGILISGFMFLGLLIEGEEMAFAFFGALFVFAIILAFEILYYILAIRTVSTIMTTTKTGVPSDKVSLFIAVCAFITGAYNFIMMFVGFTFLKFLTGLCTTAALIGFGIIILTYRNEMKAAMAPGGYQPQPMQAPFGGQFFNNIQANVFGQRQNTTAQNVQNPTPNTQTQAQPQAQAQSQTETVVCPNCGASVTSAAGTKKFCPHCGTEIK